MFNPTQYPYVRAATYADANPPPVLSDVFYNPTQDALARAYGASAGYSTSLAYEEFLLPLLTFTPNIGDPIGVEMTTVSNFTGGWEVESIVPSAANMHGVLEIRGLANGDRGGAPGFETADAYRFLDELRWIFRCRIRCSNFAPFTGGGDPGIVIGLGDWASALPIWYANDAGFWGIQWDGGAMLTAEPTVDDEWVELWIAREEIGGDVKWYIKRDADPLPTLVATKTLTGSSLISVRRYIQGIVDGSAVAADYLQVDAISLGCER